MAGGVCDELGHLFREPSIGAASKLAFLRLWEAAGKEPGEIMISLADLGHAYGRSRRAARKWIDELAAAGLVQIDDHDDRRGRVYLTVWSPHPGRRERRPDLQQRLPLSFDRPELAEPAPRSEGNRADVSAPKGPSEADRADVTARKGPPKPPRADVSAHKRPATPCEGEGEGKPHARARAVDVDVVKEDKVLLSWSAKSTSTSTVDQKETDQETDDEPAVIWRDAVEDAFRWLAKFPRLRAGIKDPRNRSLWLKSNYLARAELSEQWLRDSLEAMEQVIASRGGNPWAYLHTCLANRAWGEHRPDFQRGVAARAFHARLASIDLTMADDVIRLRRHFERAPPLHR